MQPEVTSMKIKEICIIVQGYPYKSDPFFAFIRPVVCAMADFGYNCTVIAPQSISFMPGKKKTTRPKEWFDVSDGGEKIRVLQPPIFTFSNIKLFGYLLTGLVRRWATQRCYKKYVKNTDCFYAHFWGSVVMVGSIAKKKNIPVYVVTGESTINITSFYPRKYIHKNLTSIKGIISVSSKNLEESRSLGLITGKIPNVVLPNAVSRKEFNLIEKKYARKQLGLPEDAVIALFVGYLIERKGPMRVLEAAKRIKELRLVFLGKGEQIPTGEQVLYVGSVPHTDMVKYMCASDYFVLPTKAEGCCNAIVEAIVCGLPVVSSDMPFNYDILDESNAIFVDPENIEQLSQAMMKITRDEDYRYKLAKGSKSKAKDFFIDQRVERIMRFMEENYE